MPFANANFKGGDIASRQIPGRSAFRIAIDRCLLGILEYGHGRIHATEPEPPVEIFLAWNGVKNDLPVAVRCNDQALDDFTPKAAALM